MVIHSINQTSPVRLLIADNDTVLLKTLGRLFSKEGYEVVLSEDGKQALQHARIQPFDLALIDLNMPERNGIATLKELKQHAPKMPVIILTGVGNWDTHSEAIEHHADHFPTKPLRRDQLLSLVKDMLSIQSP